MTWIEESKPEKGEQLIVRTLANYQKDIFKEEHSGILRLLEEVCLL